MTTVFFESSAHAEKVATFESDELYMICADALEKYAAEGRMIVTTSEETL